MPSTWYRSVRDSRRGTSASGAQCRATTASASSCSGLCCGELSTARSTGKQKPYAWGAKQLDKADFLAATHRMEQLGFVNFCSGWI